MSSPHHRWSSRARVTERGPDGAISRRRVVDWLQETAAAHCDRAGWPIDALLRAGATWFVRSMELHFERPIQWREPIEVETWVSDRKRFRTHREYRVRASGELVVRGQTQWIYLEQEPSGTFRPARIPEAMEADFGLDPAGALDGVDRLADSAPGPDGAGDALARDVHVSDTDANGHANHGAYLDWIDDLLADGATPPDLRALRLDFLADARPGERLRLVRPPGDDPRCVSIRRGDDELVQARVAVRGR